MDKRTSVLESSETKYVQLYDWYVFEDSWLSKKSLTLRWII